MTEKKDYIKRSSGVLMHVSSLPGDYSIGSFGDGARKFIDFLSDCGFGNWQVLPFCMTDEFNSPYKSFSAFAGNPYFIDLPELERSGLLTRSELDGAKQSNPYTCEYARLYRERINLLSIAAKRAAEKEEAAKIAEFIDKNEYISQACLFMAIKDANGGLPWYEWKTESFDKNRLFVWQFIQYTFFRQWNEIKKYAGIKKVKIIGDIPIYVSYDSCDVWANRENFLIDEDGKPSCVAGVPPDYFSADGQLWGNPLYDWEKMEQDGFSWWNDRIAHNLTMFDGVRIDHFRGLESYWSVPSTEKTAKNGKWEKGPGRKLTDVIAAAAGDKLIIAEDLGVITKEVADLRDESGFPGMRVLQFAFLGDSDSPHLPHNYVNNCVAYTGTHDNNTLLGWVWEMDNKSRARALEYFGYDGDWNRCYPTLIRAMLASTAGIVIMPIQDILGYGSDTRLNRPGRADGNWEYRVTAEQLATIDRAKYKRLNELYARY